MTVVTDTTQATQSLQRLAATAQQAQMAMRGGNPAFAGFAGAGGQTGAALARAGQLAGGAGPGLLGRVGGYLGPVGLGLLGANQLGQSAAAIGRAVNDPYTDNLGTGRDLFRSIVPFGSTIQGWWDDISGRNAAFEQADVRNRQRMAEQQGRLDLQSFNLGYNPQQAGLEARARGLAGARSISEGTFDRSTAEGEKAFRDRQRMLPLERESAKAEREAAAAAAQRTAANKELANVEKRQNELVAERKKLERDVDNTSGAKRQEALFALQRNEEETKAQAGLRRQAAQQSAEAARQAAQAKAASDMVGVRKLQAEAGMLEEDAATAAGGARRLGTMDAFDRADAVESLRLLKQFGPEALDPQQVQAALSIAPETAGKVVEKFGAGTAEFRALMKEAPADFAGDPEKLRQEAAAKRDEAARKELEVEATLARSSAEAGRDLGKMVADSFQKVVDAAKNEILTQLRLAKNAK